MSTPGASVFIGTPTLNGVVAAGYVVSLMAMTAGLHADGIGTQYKVVDGPNIAVQRDLLARDFLRSPCSHLLCVAGDMTFPPDLCRRLLGAAKPLAGIVCPLGSLDLPRLARLSGTRSFEDALALAHDWNLELDGDSLTVRDGFARVAAIGADFLLVARDCLTTLAERAPPPVYEFEGDRSPLSAFFRALPGETIASRPNHVFARRWARAGGEVWAYVEARAGPVRDFAYGVPFARYLEARRRAAPLPAGG